MQGDRWTCPFAARNLELMGRASHQMPKELYSHEVRRFLAWDAPVEGALFVFGGRSGRLGDARQYLSAVEYLDPTSLEWRSAPDMKFARVGLAACFLVDSFYVIGGYNQQSGDPQMSVERLNVLTMEWSDCAPLLVPRYGHSACVCDGKIYVMGGDHAGVLIPHAERYDPTTNTWERIPDMPIRVAASRAVSIDEKIYLFGGCDPSVPGDRASDAILMFDPALNRWTVLDKRMALGRTAFSLAPLVGRRKGVVIAGGFDLSSRPEIEMRSVEIIRDLIPSDEESDRPASPAGHPPPLPIPRAGCQGVSIPTSLLAAPLAEASSMPFIVLGGEYVDPMTGRCRVFDNATMLVNSEFLSNQLERKKASIGFAGRALMALKRRRGASLDLADQQHQWSDQVIPPMMKKRTAFAACVGKVWPKGFGATETEETTSSTADSDSGRERARSAWSDVISDWFQ